MGEVHFYHMMRSPLEAVLPRLLGRALEAGWHVAVRGRDAERLERLDRLLWEGEEAAFLPHGLAGGPHDAEQPVLLTTGAERPNGAQCLMLIDGAAAAPADCAALRRTCILFDGSDDDAVAAARAQWKALTGAGLAAKYWSDEEGRWQMKAEAAGAARDTGDDRK